MSKLPTAALSCVEGRQRQLPHGWFAAVLPRSEARLPILGTP